MQKRILEKCEIINNRNTISKYKYKKKSIQHCKKQCKQADLIEKLKTKLNRRENDAKQRN